MQIKGTENVFNKIIEENYFKYDFQGKTDIYNFK